MTRLQTQAEANAYWETVELKKWVVTFTAGSRNKRRNAESLVTSRTATGARKAAIRHQQTECGNDWVTSAMSTVRLATAQDLGCVPTAAEVPPAAELESVLINGTAYEVHPVVAAVILRLQIELQQVATPADALDAEKHDPNVDKAWAQFCAGIGDGASAPYPGMIAAFERYYTQSFADKDWRNEASVWAAAWKKAKAEPTEALDAEMVKKAQRYDWLRNHPLDGLEETTPFIHAAENDDEAWGLNGRDADEKIDAAIAAQETHQEVK